MYDVMLIELMCIFNKLIPIYVGTEASPHGPQLKSVVKFCTGNCIHVGNCSIPFDLAGERVWPAV